MRENMILQRCCPGFRQVKQLTRPPTDLPTKKGVLRAELMKRSSQKLNIRPRRNGRKAPPHFLTRVKPPVTAAWAQTLNCLTETEGEKSTMMTSTPENTEIGTQGEDKIDMIRNRRTTVIVKMITEENLQEEREILEILRGGETALVASQ